MPPLDDLGSPFRYEITRRAPEFVRRYCPPRADVLDVGCGSGRYALFFVEAGVAGSYTGVDISDARRVDLPLPADFPARFVQLDAHRLSQLGREFDFAISLTAFEHFADDRAVAREMAAVMKPGAHALLALPALWSWPLYGPHGYRRYSPAAIRALAAAAGLKLVELRKVSGLAGWLFHFLWFAPATAIRLIGKLPAFLLAGGDKAAARRRWPRWLAWLDRVGQHHLRTDAGRRLHRGALRVVSRADRLLPILEVGYFVVLRKGGNATPGVESPGEDQAPHRGATAARGLNRGPKGETKAQ